MCFGVWHRRRPPSTVVDSLAESSTLTLGDRDETAAVWSPDGARLVFNAGRRGGAGPTDLFVKLSSGAGSEEPLLSGSGVKMPSSWSADGRFLLYSTPGPDNADVWLLPLAADRKPSPFMQTTSDEGGARFSPDGRWVAYGSNQTGRAEIFVAPFPATGKGRSCSISLAASYGCVAVSLRAPGLASKNA